MRRAAAGSASPLGRHAAAGVHHVTVIVAVHPRDGRPDQAAFERPMRVPQPAQREIQPEARRAESKPSSRMYPRSTIGPRPLPGGNSTSNRHPAAPRRAADRAPSRRIVGSSTETHVRRTFRVDPSGTPRPHRVAPAQFPAAHHVGGTISAHTPITPASNCPTEPPGGPPLSCPASLAASPSDPLAGTQCPAYTDTGILAIGRGLGGGFALRNGH